MMADAAVREQLDRILSSPLFWHAESLKKLLTYLIEETLAGRAADIKEYVLGVVVFERGESFDPREDTIVRVQARRLRAKLDEYYLKSGQSDPVVITLPKGAYVPAFQERRHSAVATAASAPSSRRWLYAAALAMLIAAGTLPLRNLGTRERSSPSSLAVLPFANLTGDAQKDYIGDGLTEELIGKLSRRPGLHVAARTSVVQYKNKAVDIRTVARKLGVGAVLEGSFRAIGGRLRVSAQLINAADGFHLWSEDYDGELDQISDKIAAAVEANTKAPVLRQLTSNKAAYESYMRGLWLARQGTQASMSRGIDAFREAAAADPRFAQAFAQLASAYVEEVSAHDKRPRDFMPKARDAALRALSLNDALPEGHLALGMVQVAYDWEWRNGCKEIARAVQLNPNDAHARLIYAGFCLLRDGRFEEAHEELRTAQMLDPAAQAVGGFETTLYVAERRYDAILERCRKIGDVYPDAYWIYPVMGLTYARKGMFDEAQKMLDRASQYRDGSSKRISVLAQLHAMMGQRDKAVELAHGLENESHHAYLPPTYIALIYGRLGDMDRAFVWLDKAYEERCNRLTSLKVNEAFDPLRTDPRFLALLMKMHLDSSLI